MTSVAIAIALIAGGASAQPNDTTPKWIAERQIEAFNRRDIDGFMALYAEDAVVAEFPSGKVLMTGKAEIRKHYSAMLKANDIPPVRVEPRVVNGAFVVDN